MSAIIYLNMLSVPSSFLKFFLGFCNPNHIVLPQPLWAQSHSCPQNLVFFRFCPSLSSLLVYMLSHSVVSDSLQPYRLQPLRLFCPWDFAGKNTEWVAISFSRRSSQPRDETHVSCVSLNWQVGSLRLVPPGFGINKMIFIHFRYCDKRQECKMTKISPPIRNTLTY